MPLLEVDMLRAGYGAVDVIRDVSFSVSEGEIVTLLGSNGAGKTTTLRTIAGLLRPSAGSIRLDGRDTCGLPAHRVKDLGLALVPEGRQLFSEHTVRENLELGGYRRLMQGDRKGFHEDLESALTLFPRVRERLSQPAGLLSGGEQQMVAIARALVGKPRLLVLDEPSLGLSPLLVEIIFAAFELLRQKGLTILLVEQMAVMGLKISDRAYVLDAGRVILSGGRDEVSADPRVMEAYLGRGTV